MQGVFGLGQIPETGALGSKKWLSNQDLPMFIIGRMGLGRLSWQVQLMTCSLDNQESFYLCVFTHFLLKCFTHVTMFPSLERSGQIDRNLLHSVLGKNLKVHGRS